MSAERRLKATHKTVMLALHQSAQELQGRLQEIQAAIDGQIQEWVPVYGLDTNCQHRVEGRPDGELYLVEIPAANAPQTGEQHAQAEGGREEVEHGDEPATESWV